MFDQGVQVRRCRSRCLNSHSARNCDDRLWLHGGPSPSGELRSLPCCRSHDAYHWRVPLWLIITGCIRRTPVRYVQRITNTRLDSWVNFLKVFDVLATGGVTLSTRSGGLILLGVRLVLKTFAFCNFGRGTPDGCDILI